MSGGRLLCIPFESIGYFVQKTAGAMSVSLEGFMSCVLG